MYLKQTIEPLEFLDGKARFPGRTLDLLSLRRQFRLHMTAEHMPASRNAPLCQTKHIFLLTKADSKKGKKKNTGMSWKGVCIEAAAEDSHGSWKCAPDPGACWQTALRKWGRWWRCQWVAGRRRDLSRCISGSGSYRGLIGSVGGIGLLLLTVTRILNIWTHLSAKIFVYLNKLLFILTTKQLYPLHKKTAPVA